MASTAVEQIKEKLSIVDVVGTYVELIHSGKNYKAKSPFTNEKTPSFYVSPDRGMYYCFSSQKGGDIFTFIQEMEAVDFKGALKILAEKANVELVQEDPKKRDDRETAYALLEEATQYFFKAREEFPHISEYIEKRGVKGQTIHAWRIGYAKDEWRALRTYLKEKGYTDEQMFNAGLIKRADEGKEPYDVFRDRIMFPIFDPSGRVVAFSGRTLKKEDGIPKYVNSPETELFQKSEILYGYDKAKQGIRNLDFSLVVEGQFDVVLSHQAGYTNTVAVSGTAFTKHHMMLLSRFSPNVVLALDADRAGISAVKRSAVPLLQHGMNVKVAHMPDGQDPADVVRDNPHELKRIVGESVHAIEFLLQHLIDTEKEERKIVLKTRNEVCPLIVAIRDSGNRVDGDYFINFVAKKIGVAPESIRYEVERIENERRESPHTTYAEREEVRTEAHKHSKRVELEKHLSAQHQVLTSEYPWIASELVRVLTRIVGEDTARHFWTDAQMIEPSDVFTFESSLEKKSEKQLVEDIRSDLERYKEVVARETLQEVMKKQLEAQERGDEDEGFRLAGETKKAEQLRNEKIVIEKP